MSPLVDTYYYSLRGIFLTGYEYLDYDAMGNVSMSDKTIVVPTENMAYRFMTEFGYDSFGRMRRITYPDGENVIYNYDWGLLYSVKNEDQQTPYIQYIYYDEYGRPIETKYGNGFVATSGYDDVRHWAVQRELRDTSQTFLQQTDYEYDGVGNITRVAQSAPTYDNNLGGEYIVDYTYDDQYRLIDAWQYNSILGDYSYSMDYSPSGLAGYKNSPELDADIVFGYRYEGEFPLSHQPKMIYSPSYYEDMTLLGWNTNGQMTSMVQPYQDRFRKHLWDEAGQLTAAFSNEYCGYYGYNANGERVYKLTGTVYADQYNAGDVNIDMYFDDMVLYVNPYMVITPRGYTKHYYNGSHRIAARLGDYWADSGMMMDESDRMYQAREVLEERLNSTEAEEDFLVDEIYRSVYGEEFYVEPFVLRTNYMNCIYDEDMLWEVFNGNIRQSDDVGGIAQGIFYYHSDHLGSANWITNDQGQAVQYIHYMPYGELWVNQQAYSYDERFKFTGKERDTETGYDYFGARYYSPMIGHWLSPDPLANKYPNISPYAYCSWNPLRYVDPNGMEITITGEDGVTVSYAYGSQYEGSDSFTQEMWSNLDEMHGTTSGGRVLDELINDNGNPFNITSQIARNKDGISVRGYVTNGSRTFKMGGEDNLPIEGFAHEMFHAYQDLHGYGGASCANDVEAYLFQDIFYGEYNNTLPSFGCNSGSPIGGASQTYKNAYYSIFDGRPSIWTMNILSIGFKENTRAGVSGVANKYSIFSNKQQYRILDFWPK